MIISAYSKYLSYQAGGAEESTRILLEKEWIRTGNRINIISHDSNRFLGRSFSPNDFPEEWNKIFIPNMLNIQRFSYFEYLVNRSKVINWFSKLESGELWTYGLYAPAAVKGFNGISKYFIRSESDLGIDGNYHSGKRRAVKSLHSKLQSPAKRIYLRDLSGALESSLVISNSKYMASRASHLFGVDCKVIYPPVEIESYRRNLASEALAHKWVVFVGDSAVKGIDYVLAAANRLPSLNFRIFSRRVCDARQENNVTWMPWEKESWRVFRGALLVIVPSQWEEGYGRVAREAHLLGIPVLVSNAGGLPEAVDDDPSKLVDDFRNPDEWVKRIREVL
jgi:glycosyltransferase involved in cell wall biosynthesis